ncbi:FMN-binding negative transcriptional regulator [Bradyrhizobium sp. USDA 4454]
MYLPPHFKMEELGAIHAAMQASRLATLVTATADGLIGNPLVPQLNRLKAAFEQ